MAFVRRFDFPSLILLISYTLFCILKNHLTPAHGLVGFSLAAVYVVSIYIQFKVQPQLQEEIAKLKVQTQDALDKNSSHINSEVEKLKTEFSKFQMIKNQDIITKSNKVRF